MTAGFVVVATLPVIFCLILLAEDRLKAVDRYVSRSETTLETDHSGPAYQPNCSATECWNPEERRHHKIERLYWFIGSILTFVAVCGAIISVIISQLTLHEAQLATQGARLQAKIAFEALIQSERPILVVTNVSGPIGHPHSTIGNIGTKPAILQMVQMRVDKEKKVSLSTSSVLDECHSEIGHFIIKPAETWSSDCVSRPVNDSANEFYGQLIYVSMTTGAKWRYDFGFLYNARTDRWGDDGGVGSNEEVRIDRNGNPIFPLRGEKE